jgi:hypothetical protein
LDANPRPNHTQSSLVGIRKIPIRLRRQPLSGSLLMETRSKVKPYTTNKPTTCHSDARVFGQSRRRHVRLQSLRVLCFYRIRGPGRSGRLRSFKWFYFFLGGGRGIWGREKGERGKGKGERGERECCSFRP